MYVERPGLEPHPRVSNLSQVGGDPLPLGPGQAGLVLLEAHRGHVQPGFPGGERDREARRFEVGRVAGVQVGEQDGAHAGAGEQVRSGIGDRERAVTAQQRGPVPG
jgi:hypothetical protein